MSITKNPFEKPFHGVTGKNKPEPKPDVTLTPSKRAALPDPPDPKTDPKKSVTHSGGLPPTRKGPEKGEDVVTGRNAAGFQKANPFKPPRHAKVKGIKQRVDDPPGDWNPKKLPEDPSKKPAVVTTKQGQEVVVTTAAPDDYNKRVEKSGTGEDAQKELQAQQEAERQKQMFEQGLVEQKKQQQQNVVNANKAREIMAKMANLQLQLAPNMDAAQVYSIHGELEKLRTELAQLNFFG